MKANTVIYSLIVEDIQTVSNQEIGRNLSEVEINLIRDKIGDKINWYDAIAESIIEEKKIVPSN